MYQVVEPTEYLEPSRSADVINEAELLLLEL
jgi:hypothetical protein